MEKQTKKAQDKEEEKGVEKISDSQTKEPNSEDTPKKSTGDDSESSEPNMSPPKDSDAKDRPLTDEEWQKRREEEMKKSKDENEAVAKDLVSDVPDEFVLIGKPTVGKYLAQSTMAKQIPHGTIILRRTVVFTHFCVEDFNETTEFCPGVILSEKGELVGSVA